MVNMMEPHQKSLGPMMGATIICTNWAIGLHSCSEGQSKCLCFSLHLTWLVAACAREGARLAPGRPLERCRRRAISFGALNRLHALFSKSQTHFKPSDVVIKIVGQILVEWFWSFFLPFYRHSALHLHMD